MKTLSLIEFRAYCEERPIERIIYNTENNWAGDSMMGLSLSFNSLIVSAIAGMNYVYFSSDTGFMRLSNVEHIKVGRHCAAWDVVTIYSKEDRRDIPYIFLFDY